MKKLSYLVLENLTSLNNKSVNKSLVEDYIVPFGLWEGSKKISLLSDSELLKLGFIKNNLVNLKFKSGLIFVV